uniref:Cadherin domain-containing protein n=1 Tax=Ciona savignyi TaxID=51511 RepID=H2ZF78_CIOSA
SILLGFILFSQAFRACQAQDSIILDFNVLENATIGTEIGRLDTTEQNGYYITSEDSNPFMQYFDRGVVENQGIIKTIKKLDHETFSSFDIAVYDSVLNRYFEVRIDVTDINDHAPEFRVSQLNLTISEASQIGAKYNLGTAVDPDSDPFNVQGYTIISGNEDKAFRLNNRHINGQIYVDLIVNQTLNRELVSNYSFTVEAFDGDVPPKTGQLDVYIDISDVNDNPPVFDFSRYTVRLSENEPVGRDVITLNATDQDIGQNAMLTYRIDRSQSDPGFIFEIESNSGRIYLNKKLDFEQVVQHKLVVEARDEGSEPQVGSTVVIVEVTDVNDNEPQINVIFLDAGEAKVSEGAEPGDYIARVSVSDQDLGELSQVNVSLEGGNGRFGLQTENNIIYLVCVKLKLDRETESLYHITLNAVDFGSPPQSATTSFTITVEDINDNPPRFPSDLIEIELSQSAFPGTFVTQLQSTDADIGRNAEVTYRLDGSPQSLWLNINPHSGLITTARSLDSLTSPELQVTVWATDGGTPALASNATLVIRLSDAVNSPPRFQSSSYAVSVPEDAAVGHCFLKVHATDPDSSVISYSFVIGSLQDPPTNFQVNSSSGDVCVTSSLNRETTASYDLQIQATDQGGQWDRAPLVITIEDVNDNKPVFSPVSYVINVDRNADVGTPITKLTATDADDVTGSGYGRVTFVMTSGNDEALFALDTETGRISVAKPLTTNGVGSMYEIDVAAVDGGGLSSDVDASVVISIVDGSSTGGPVFTQARYFFQASEADPKETLLGTISATANDGRAVTYFIRHDPPHSTWFSVRPTGDVIVRSPMDREIFPSITFQVIASSGSPPIFGFAMVTVTISDVNDNPPHFISSSAGRLEPIIIPFSSLVGATLHSVVAIDNDEGRNGQVKYRLQSDFFSIDSNTGVILLTSALPHQATNYSVTIEAYDQGQSPHVTSVELIIRTIQPDPNCPVFPEDFRFSVAEDTALSKSTTNSTAKIAYYLQSSSSAFIFSIFSNGSLYLIRGLDYETQDTYSFEVTAVGFPISPTFAESCFATADVTIEVTDVNDNAPIFSKQTYRFNIEENKESGTVGVVSATDADSGDPLVYSFVVNSEIFSLHRSTGKSKLRLWCFSYITLRRDKNRVLLQTCGVITTLTSVDYDITKEYSILVQVSDGQHLAQSLMRITVIDVNDNSPQFVLTSAEHLAVVSVEAQTGTWVADLKATDADSDANGEISYSSTTQDDDMFHIVGNTGSIIVNTALSMGLYSVQVTAQDNGSPIRQTSTTLQVSGVSANENPAEFNSNKFVFAPIESSNPGTVLGTRRSLPSYPQFRIASGNDDGMFHINRTTGDLVLLHRFDSETKSQYLLEVEKRESFDISRIISAQINLRDVNDHTPRFNSGSMIFGVEENTRIGEEVYRFRAVDPDSGLSGRLTYSLVSQTPASVFRINSDTGALFVDSGIDREAVDQYILVVNVTDRSPTSPRFSTASARVIVRDVNDNSPRFVGHHMTYVAEDEPIGYPAMRLAAEDADAGVNGRVMYAIESVTSDLGNSAEEMSYFHIDSNTAIPPIKPLLHPGVITVAKQLDFERSKTHSINVSASDLATNQRTTHQMITIHLMDVNDVTPHFERTTYQAEVMEGQIAGTIVTKVTALDEDSGENGLLTYQLQASSESAAFVIDPNNEVISLAMELDRENKSSYRLTVFAQDSAFPSLYDWCFVLVTVVDVNDNAPQFSPLDGSIVPPLLSRLEIPEHIEGPQVVHTIAARDADIGENGQITYAISGEHNDIRCDFSINPSTGELSITRRLDRELTGLYQLQVTASDNIHTTSGQIEVTVLDWNDNDPQFVAASYNGQVAEGLSRGQYVLTVRATDADIGLNGEISYFLSNTTGLDGKFTVDTMTGVVTTTAPLDREEKGSYNFLVEAVDAAPYGPRSSTVPVSITVSDVNDNPPVFVETLIRVNISRATNPGVTVAHVTANDADTELFGSVTYSFGNESMNQTVFEIDRIHGNIRTREAIPSNFPNRSSLIILASDGGNPPMRASAVIEINLDGEFVNFAYLQFDQMSYEVVMSETVQRGHRVTTVSATLHGATPSGSNMVYQLNSGNENEAFAMSSEGVITVDKPSLLDYETEPNIRLIVSASVVGDGPYTAIHGYATVYIQLQDENDNSPRFTQDIYSISVWEEQQPGIFVMPVQATDADSENNGWVWYFISSGNLDESFELEPLTGFLKTKLKLDREVHEKYTLIVNAVDQSEIRRTGTSTVSVLVVDTNDHSPTLNVPAAPLLVSEGTAVGSLITTVTANDQDASPVITFSFPQEGNPGEHFSIDRNEGKIFLNKPLDFERSQNFTLTIQASDIGSDVTHNVTQNIHVVVTDVNDNPPVFLQQSYHTTFPELALPNTHVITVQAKDLDSHENGRVSYRLDNVLPNKPIFQINHDTGEITVNKSEPLNPQSSVFNLEVEAYDHGSPRRVQSASVRVQITDINNNPPMFNQQGYEASVIESASRDFSIINITATDADYSRDNNVIVYRILSGNTDKVFKIRTIDGPGTQVFGEICVAGELDRESVDRYSLTVAAIDQGTPSLSSNTTVLINVLDVNDNRPTFNQTSYHARVQYTFTKNVHSQLYANEDDLTPDFKFKIISGNDDNAFELGDCVPATSDCAMLVSKYVDYEVQSHYELTVQVWDDRDSALAKSAIVSVIVDVDDVNEYPPTFTILFKQAEIPENAKANTTLLRLVADDNDGGAFGHVTYSLSRARSRSTDLTCTNDRDIMRVNSATGEVYATQDLDFEQCDRYFFYVVATDAGGSSDIIPVSIDVLPVDEFAPMFHTDSAMGYRFLVPYGSPEGYVVGQVNSTDADMGADGKVQYFFEDTSVGHGYVINVTSGVIRLSEQV